MASSINASTTAGLVNTADTSGVLQLQTAGTTAVSISAAQVVSYTNQPVYSGGTANGVAYLNGSKVLTTGSALVFDGTNLGVGVTPSAWASAYKVLDVGNTASFYLDSSGAVVSNNSFINSAFAYKYKTSNSATRYEQTSAGQHQWFNAASGTAGNTITFTQAMTLDASGNLGVGVTSPTAKLQVGDGSTSTSIKIKGTAAFLTLDGSSYGQLSSTSTLYLDAGTGQPIVFRPNGSTDAARIDTSGNLLVGKTVITFATAGARITPLGQGVFTVSNDEVLAVNRLTNDGKLIGFYQDTSEEGNISVSGTTVSYNGGHLSRWAQMLTKPELFKGTVMSNLDEMNVYTKDGQPVDNEQLNKVKVSDTEGDVNVAGVFVNWSHDEDHNVDEINMAMTGDMIIRIAQGTTVARGDLLMSAGDGTAKPQGDDIVRSKTVAKVTSNHVTCTYEDGSYCVPCVLMAC